MTGAFALAFATSCVLVNLQHDILPAIPPFTSYLIECLEKQAITPFAGKKMKLSILRTVNSSMCIATYPSQRMMME